MRRRRHLRVLPYVLPLAATALLAGCGDDPGASTATDDPERSATGQVLEGTISDAMLPLDRLRSHAPQAEPVPEDADGAAASGSAATAALEDDDESSTQAESTGESSEIAAQPALDLPPEADAE